MGSPYGSPKRRAPVPEVFSSSFAAVDTSKKADRAHAVAEIFRKLHSGLVRMLTARTGSLEDAKEIMQEAYVRVLALDRSGMISVLPGYLWRIAVNVAIDRKRKDVLQQRFCRSAEPLEEIREFPPESTLESEERLAILERAIDRLPPRCLEAFVLHVQNGLTFDEVGREMRISSRMAQKHLARALEYLQSCLDAADATRSGR